MKHLKKIRKRKYVESFTCFLLCPVKDETISIWVIHFEEYRTYVKPFATRSTDLQKNGQHYHVSRGGVTHLITDADQKLLWLHYPNSHLQRMMRTGKGRGKGGTKQDLKKNHKRQKQRDGVWGRGMDNWHVFKQSWCWAEQMLQVAFVARTWWETLVHPSYASWWYKAIYLSTVLKLRQWFTIHQDH